MIWLSLWALNTNGELTKIHNYKHPHQKQERFQINNLNFHLKAMDKEQKRAEGRIKIRVETNEIENRNQQINW